jgi:hypothetical protein
MINQVKCRKTVDPGEPKKTNSAASHLSHSLEITSVIKR